MKSFLSFSGASRPKISYGPNNGHPGFGATSSLMGHAGLASPRGIRTLSSPFETSLTSHHSLHPLTFTEEKLPPCPIGALVLLPRVIMLRTRSQGVGNRVAYLNQVLPDLPSGDFLQLRHERYKQFPYAQVEDAEWQDPYSATGLGRAVANSAFLPSMLRGN